MAVGATVAQLLIIGLANGAIIALNGMSVSLVYSVVRIINLPVIMVVIGGARRQIAPLVGALLIEAYDLILIPRLGAWVEARLGPGQLKLWAMVDPRVHNFFVFGLLLYCTVWYRARQPEAPAARAELTGLN